MSRTDAHTRWKFLPDGMAYEREWAWVREDFLHRHMNMEWSHEWNSHFSRWSGEQWYAHQENRRERHNAKAALRRGDYDAIPFHMTGRHSAAWLAY